MVITKGFCLTFSLGTVCLVAGIANPLFVSPAWGGGLWLYELGTPDMGTASAGRAASAMDASTAGTNPAGMTRLDRSQLLVGAEAIIFSLKFDADPSSTYYADGNGGDAGSTIPAGSISYVYNATPDLKFGVAAGSYFGLGLEFENNWAGRYYLQEADFLTFTVNPAVGYRLNDQFSIGAGVDVVYTKLDNKVAVNTPLAAGDGRLEYDDHDFGYGYNIGLLYEPWEGTRFGLTYRSEVDLDFEDVPFLTNAGIFNALLSNRRIDISMTIPQAVLFSAYHELNDKVAVMGNVGWQEWSKFGQSTISVQDTSATNVASDRQFDDTWHVALGVQYRFAPAWLWSVGAAYDSSPVEDEFRTVDMALDRQIRYATGIQYDVNKDVTAGLAYTYIDAGDAPVNQTGTLRGTLTGDFESNDMHVIAGNVIWKF